MKKAPIWATETQRKSRKERSTASHAGAQAPSSPQTAQGSVDSLLPFNLIHTKLPNFKFTPSTAATCSMSPGMTQTQHELLYLCKHTRAPSSSSSTSSQQPHIHPKPGEHPKTSDPPQQRHSGFKSCSAQPDEGVITFASSALNRTHSSCWMSRGWGWSHTLTPPCRLLPPTPSQV